LLSNFSCNDRIFLGVNVIKDTNESNIKKGNLFAAQQGIADSDLEKSIFNSENHDVSTVVSARGTEEGLILRIDGKAEWSLIVDELDAFLGGKKRFFEGGELSVEWLERLPTKEQSSELETYLRDNFGISIVQRKRKLARFIKSVSNSSLIPNTQNELKNYTTDDHAKGVSLNLFEDEKQGFSSASESLLERVERLATGEENYRLSTESHMRNGISQDGPISFASGSDIESRGVYSERVAQFFGSDLLLDEEANARIVFGTLRSGQRVETPFTLIVIGDVNPGADLIAGGDVIVLGSLRGTAHAGAYEDDLIDRAIIAFQMQPMQLRIGSVVSRGSKDVGKGPEMARIDNRSIVVEQFSSKILAARKGK
jgi:septum site-determining protein MinC